MSDTDILQIKKDFKKWILIASTIVGLLSTSISLAGTLLRPILWGKDVEVSIQKNTEAIEKTSKTLSTHIEDKEMHRSFKNDTDNFVMKREYDELLKRIDNLAVEVGKSNEKFIEIYQLLVKIRNNQ